MGSGTGGAGVGLSPSELTNIEYFPKQNKNPPAILRQQGKITPSFILEF